MAFCHQRNARKTCKHNQRTQQDYNPLEVTMLTAGQKAPNFSLLGDDGQVHNLKDFLGHNLVIFFYPKDMTPGCTTEACDFSDAIAQFKSYDAQVIGISKDSLASHIKFKGKHELQYPLLSDP